MSRAVPVKNIFIDLTSLRHDVPILFDDGVVINCNYKDLIIFRYFLDFVPKYKNIKINSNLWIGNYKDNGYFNYGTYKNMYSSLLYDFVENVIKVDNNISLLPKLLKDIFKTFTNTPNALKDILPKYVVGVEIQDILKVQMRKSLLDTIADVHKDPTQINIEKTYDELDRVIKEDLADDDIIRLIYLSGMVNKNQMKQLFGSRGFITEINSTIFRKPMCNSFTLGFKDMYEAIIESRSGAKALFVSTKSIQSSEHLARELQLASMPVEDIVFEDCKSTSYKDFFVQGPEVFDGMVTYNGDLPNLVGKRFLNENGVEEVIKSKGYDHLNGKTIKLRRVSGCNHPDKKAICYKCYGDLAYSVFPHQNAGHLNTVNITKPATQAVLSTKHLNSSASSVKVVLGKLESEYLTIKGKDRVNLHRRLFGRVTKGIKIIIPQKYVRNFASVIEENDILSMNLAKASKLSVITILEYSKKTEEIYELKLSKGKRYTMLTIYFWDYLIRNGYEVDDNGNYVVDLKTWNPSNPILSYENKEFDFTMLVSEFKSMIRTRKYFKDKATGKFIPEFTPDVLVEKLFRLLNQKLNVNIALIEVLVYAFTARDYNDQNFDLSRNATNPTLIGLANAIDGRSLGASMNWNRLSTKVYHGVLFKNQGKPDHILDVLFKPTEVTKSYRK